MYEELYVALPAVDRYWERLGLAPAAGQPDAALLDRIIGAHQSSIPFDNLDVCDFHLPVSLGIPDLFEKIIVGTRGGYCFELNALFDAFLTEVGFEVAPCMARSLKDYGYLQPVMHRGALVTLNGRRLYCDVGYGGPLPACALPLEDGALVTSCGQVFRVDAAAGSWWHISYCGSVESDVERPATPVLAFLDQPLDTVDFVPLSHFASTHPNSVFTQRRMVNRRTDDGNVSITADQFTQVGAAGKEQWTISGEEEFRALLAQHFGIVLSR
ncbi:arylamine N-acetyltransferase family protein [Gordonibacter sp.]|uniref:arylamine N-acetyltransferase family protein n=1 Tax=Gordonibacter sp. TaxID=1968902 RepID=UPI002FC8CB60